MSKIDNTTTTWTRVDTDGFSYDTSTTESKVWTCSTHYPKIPYGDITCLDISKIKGVYYIRLGYKTFEQTVPVSPESNLLKDTIRKAKRKSIKKFRKLVIQTW